MYPQWKPDFQKSLTDFFRENQIRFSKTKTLQGEIITTLENFPRLCFSFDFENDYLTVWRVGGEGYTTAKGERVIRNVSYSFPCASPYRVIAKLIIYRLVTPSQVSRFV